MAFRPTTFPTLAGSTAALALCVLAGQAAAAEGAKGREFRPGASVAVDPELQALLDRFRNAQATTKSMKAGFRQVKEDDLFEKPRVQSGTFWFSQGGNFRWDYVKPEKVTLVATKDQVQRWIPAEKVLQVTDVSKNRKRLFNYFGIGSDVNNLLRHFNAKVVDGDATHPGQKLELRGKQRRVQKRIAVLEMWIDAKTSLPNAIRVKMADGGSTTWEFKDVEINPIVPADTYALKVPAGTRVERMEGKASEVVDEIVEETDTAAAPPTGK